jgi:hypothetical protein
MSVRSARAQLLLLLEECSSKVPKIEVLRSAINGRGGYHLVSRLTRMNRMRR